MHYFKGMRERIYPGRTSRLRERRAAALTNDGEFANHITSPANHLPKTYLVKVNGMLTTEQEENVPQRRPPSWKADRSSTSAASSSER